MSDKKPSGLPESVLKRTGRPSTKELKAKEKGNRGVVGRPKGDAAIMNGYKARMLASPNSRKVLDKVFDIALNDEHKHQAVCLKLVMDRIAPASSFEADVKGSGGKSGINITISGVGGAKVEPVEEIDDAEWVELEEETPEA